MTRIAPCPTASSLPASAAMPQVRVPPALWLAVFLAGGPGAATRGASLAASPERVSYAVAGSIGTEGVDGPAMVRFVPTTGVVAPAAAFPLGSFAIDPVAAGETTTTTYHQTPVAIEFWARAMSATPGAAAGPATDPVTVRGWMSGTVGGTGPAALTVLFDQGVQPDDLRFYQPRPLPPFPASGSSGSGSLTPAFLGLNGGRALLTLDPAAGALTPVPAELTLAPSVPEPAAPLVLAGLGLVAAGARVVMPRGRTAR